MLRLSPAVLTLGSLELQLLHAIDGTRTVTDLVDLAKQILGRVVPRDHISQLIETLYESLFLDTPQFRAVADDPIRPPSCLGAYQSDEQALREQMSDLFAHG